MTIVPGSAILAALLILAPLALADGTLDVAPGAADAASAQTDKMLHFALYGFYGQPVTAGHHYKLAFEDDNRTWVLYRDADSDYQRDAGEEVALTIPIVPLDAHGDGTDHVLLFTHDGLLRADVCTGDAADADGLARGARCGGDVDGDGDPDLHEANGLHNPAGADPSPEAP